MFLIGLKVRLATPHLLHITVQIQFALSCFRSPLLTASRLISFPPVTVMLHFTGWYIPKDCLKKQEVPFRNLWFVGCMRLAKAFRSLPRPSSFT